MNRRPLWAVMVVMAVTSGLTVANIYYAQPLLPEIARTFGVTDGAAALTVTLTQIGYALGMILLLPLGDLLENRSLMQWTTVGIGIALTGAAVAPTYALFLIASVLIGITSVVAQIVIPFATSLVPPKQTGAMIGTIMFGLLGGIMLARSFSSFLAALWGWRSIFLASAIAMLVLCVVIRIVLPPRQPTNPPRYGALFASIVTLVRTEPTLRRRAATQALLFSTFTAFWTGIPFLLVTRFGFSQAEIGLYALVGAAGALAAPIAGRLADRGFGHRGSAVALLLAIAAIVTALAGSHGIVALVIAAIALDFSVQAHQVFSQSEIYGLNPAARSRMNTFFMTSIFLGGATSSALTGQIHDRFGWMGVCVFAGALPVVGLIVWIVHNHHLAARRRRAQAAGAQTAATQTAATQTARP